MLTRVETLRGQLASSLLRLTELQRRAERAASREAVLPRAFDELQRSLSELETAVEELRDQNTRLEAARIEAEQERERWQALFERAPLPYLLTDEQGTIRNVNDAGASLLAISRRFLVGKGIAMFVDSRRIEFLNELAAMATSDTPVSIKFVLRPRERAPQAVTAVLHRFKLPEGGSGLWWVFGSNGL
jgi:PAS domain S-box-containing protein